MRDAGGCGELYWSNVTAASRKWLVYGRLGAVFFFDKQYLNEQPYTPFPFPPSHVKPIHSIDILAAHNVERNSQ